MKNCVFAGSFDPFTCGHKAIAEKCLKLFDRLFLVVGENPEKTPLFSLETRLKSIRAEFEGNANVKVIAYRDTENYAEFLKENEVCAYVRGIRDEKDFAYEQRAEIINRDKYPGVVTVYISAERGFNMSSTEVRRLIREGGNYSGYLPAGTAKVIAAALENKDK